jgi:MFS transporter, SHS family, sialic acid transporter
MARRNWAFVAALLGWMFDGMEMGLFPLVASAALQDLLGPTATESLVNQWTGIITAGFLVGAATGGILFGRLGDRIGRVRAMTLSVLVYAGCSGLAGFAQAPWQMAVLRFLGALGMGGEWALGVSLVMELFADKPRGVLAGWIGAAGNLGYGVCAIISLFLNQLPKFDWAGPSNWRLLMFVGAAPGLLTLMIRLFVPESERWEQVRERGDTSRWKTSDWFYVAGGLLTALGIIVAWSVGWPLALSGVVTLFLVSATAAFFLTPIRQFLQRCETSPAEVRRLSGRLLLGAGLSGVPLLATWAGVMWQYNFVAKITQGTVPEARGVVMLVSSVGAAIGSVFVALLGDRYGRRIIYRGLCVMALGLLVSFYAMHTSYGWPLVVHAGFVGCFAAGFYGWLPLYLPELFPTRIRAIGQGFSFNFGRVLAAVGALQTGVLLRAFDNDFARACTVTAGVYLVGLVLIQLAPETHRQPLPE